MWKPKGEGEGALAAPLSRCEFRRAPLRGGLCGGGGALPRRRLGRLSPHREEALTPLFTQIAAAPISEARQAIAARMQDIVYGQASAEPWGEFAQPAGYRAQLTNLIPSAIPRFWNVEKR